MNINFEKLQSLSERFGDSFYIFDEIKANHEIKQFIDSFKKEYFNTTVAYSYKTCFLYPLIKAVKEQGFMAEVTSDYEYKLAKELGYTDSEIVYNGPYKNFSIVEQIIDGGGIVNLDSMYEVDRYCEHADKNKDASLVGIRCNYNVDGRISRFGVNYESGELIRAIRKLSKHNVGIKCLHCHIKCKDLQNWRVKVRMMVDIIIELRQNGLIDALEIVDFGGGYVYASRKGYAEIIGEEFKRLDDCKDGNNGLKIVLEPGAALSEGSMLFVAKAVNTNIVGKNKYVTIAGCTDDVSAIRKRPPGDVTVLASHTTECMYDVHIGGFTCMEDDIICSNFSSNIEVGDFVVFENVGAYSSALRSNFIRPYPMILCWNGTEMNLCRSEASEEYYFTASGIRG